MRWTWDQAKNDTNKRTHGLSFETALFVFDDPFAATRDDPFPTEQRWRTIGNVGGLTLLVVHTWPDTERETGDQIGRIISARKATKRERRAYEEGKC